MNLIRGYIKSEKLMGPTPNSEPQRASQRAAAIPGSVGNTAILSISAEAT